MEVSKGITSIQVPLSLHVKNDIFFCFQGTMPDWANSTTVSPFDKTRTYAVTPSASAAENGSKVRKKEVAEVVQKKTQNEIEHVRKKEGEIVRKMEIEHIPSAPSSELFELLCRLQSSRLDDQVSLPVYIKILIFLPISNKPLS